MERLFTGWQQPLLHMATETLLARYAEAGDWDLSGVLLVLPGKGATRHLRQLLRRHAARHGLRLTPPEMVTPADLAEHLYTAPSPLAPPLAAHCAWPERAEYAQAARAALMAEGMTLADAAARCTALPGFCEDTRWAVLARLEESYRENLARAGLADRDDARRDALQSGTLSCRFSIFLIGTVDLSSIEREMLRGLSTPVIALIAAPPEMQDGFDETGGLRPDFWQDQPLPIPEQNLCFTADPAAEAHALSVEVAALRGTSPAGKITLGVADESDAQGLALRLAARGLPTRSPYGRLLSRTRPAALLRTLLDFLPDPTARRFAALVRHPDLEEWLTGDGLVDALDVFLADHLPQRLPSDGHGLPPVIADACCAVTALLAPFAERRLLPEWADPIADLLHGVYGSEEPVDGEGVKRQLRRSLSALRAILEAVRQLPPSLAPRLSGQDALAFVLARLDGRRLPDDANADGLEMHGWLELVLDDAPALLLTGLHDTSPAPDSLLTDTLRRHLGLPDARRRQVRDAYLLRVLLESRPHLRLYVNRRGADGEPRRPSPLLFRCDGETAARRARQFTDDASVLVSPLFALGETRRLAPPCPMPMAIPFTRLRVTAFRDYLACPYRFYLRHVLKLEERDDTADEMDARRFGILLHECLAAFARDQVAESPDPAAVQAFLRRELGHQAQRQYGMELAAPVRLQVRQAGRRLDAFADWQAKQTAGGWLIQHDLSERDLEAEVIVDDQRFTVAGRVDRVDYHPGEDRYRIVDYKTGDSGSGPDTKHRGSTGADGTRPWTDLQLPLYRLLAGANGIDTTRLEVGYILLAADLRPVTLGKTGKPDGGRGYVPAEWSESDWASAYGCMENVIRALRAETFWPPAAPPRFTDAYSPLCLDRCRDRAEWLEAGGSAGAGGSLG